MAVLLLLLGLALLYVGAQTLIKGGAALAYRMGLNALVIGLTVIAYGTSAPELVVSVNASIQGSGAISIGNVVGSNICNIALILGICALIAPMTTNAQVIRREIPILIGVSALLVALLWDGWLTRFEGALLLASLIGYTGHTLRQARAEAASKAGEEYDEEFHLSQPGVGKSVALLLIGLAGLIAGSHLFVDGAVQLARAWGASDAIIGLTVVAVGTSMPELATSFVAALRKHADVSIGNVVGSNLFNVLGILGIAALLQPIDCRDISRVDLAVMFGTAVALLPIAKTGGRVTRLEGGALLLVYIGYTAWLISRVQS